MFVTDLLDSAEVPWHSRYAAKRLRGSGQLVASNGCRWVSGKVKTYCSNHRFCDKSANRFRPHFLEFAI
jgi:hypothetical protein